MTRTATALCIAALGLSAAGCGLPDDPYNEPEPKQAQTQPAPAAHGHEGERHNDVQLPADTRDPGTITSADAAPDADAAEAAVAYGLAQTNWSWRTFDTQYERMRRLASGELARQLAENRPERDQLDGIKADKQTNTAKVVAVDTRTDGRAARRVIVVLRELAGGQGVTDVAPRHTVYQATVRELPEGWRVTAWSLLP